MNFEQFTTVLANSIGELDAADLNENTLLSKLPRWDSLAILVTISLIEENCGITLNSQQIRACNTLGELFGLVAAAKS